MTAIMDGYLAVAAIAADLLGEAAVARRWATPSALPGMSVGALAGHAVHCDDLAHSAGLPTPALPDDVADTVLVLLARLAARRRGMTAVLRALSRAERAPTTITAF